MKINDSGIIIYSSKYQEKLLLVKLLSKNNGVVTGMTRMPSIKKSNIYSLGNIVEFQKFSRLSSQLGTITSEPIKFLHANIILNKKNLYSFMAITKIILHAFSENDPHDESYLSFVKFLNNINLSNFSWSDYFNLENSILKETGFGLDLTKCAVTRKDSDLKYISPKTGRAVSGEGAKGYENVLLKLPNFLKAQNEPNSKEEILEAFELYEYFFIRHLWDISKNTKALDLRNKLRALV